MAKERYHSILGLRKGKAIETVATMSNKALANWHINHTFGKLGYDRLLTKQVDKKGDKFIPDEVVSDKGQYVFMEFFMSAYNWDSVKSKATVGTLTQFHEAIFSNGIKSEKVVGKVGVLELIHSNEVERELEGARTYGVFSLDEAIPYVKVQDTLQKAILEDVVGEDMGDDEETETESLEEVSQEETVEEAVKEEEKTEAPKVEPKVETPVKEEKVEAPKVEAPKKEEPKAEAPKVEETAKDSADDMDFSDFDEETTPAEEKKEEAVADFSDFVDETAETKEETKEEKVDDSADDMDFSDFDEETTPAKTEEATEGSDEIDIEAELENL
ncbi:hypothetical protein [Bacillus thuringiensis]|uniref:hypothetical protein n=1 Tax=Bacillus thuringiensis TaxID=1428 RepID=UPI000BFE71C3|nr:hypothetical protein [Bacillus thuringiensis]PGT90017.1 hypothetical protein COD17_09715 [Bacillus thuringiensis]